jgi:hypothetical protein
VAALVLATTVVSLVQVARQGTRLGRALAGLATAGFVGFGACCIALAADEDPGVAVGGVMFGALATLAWGAAGSIALRLSLFRNGR